MGLEVTLCPLIWLLQQGRHLPPDFMVVSLCSFYISDLLSWGPQPGSTGHRGPPSPSPGHLGG